MRRVSRQISEPSSTVACSLSDDPTMLDQNDVTLTALLQCLRLHGVRPWRYNLWSGETIPERTDACAAKHISCSDGSPVCLLI